MAKLLLPEDEALIETDEIIYVWGLTETQRAARRDDVQTVILFRRGEIHLTLPFADIAERLLDLGSKSSM